MVTHTHTYIHTYIHIHTHNRNIWPSATPTANQYKHMAEGHTIETYGHTIARRRRRRHAWPILLFALVLSVYPLLISISIVRRGFCLGGFVGVGFCPFPLLSQYIIYNRKLNITLNFMFHMYDKNLYKRDVTCS